MQAKQPLVGWSPLLKYDVAVIGAGPAGSMAAKHAALAGAKVLLLEEHKEMGWPVECAGLLGLKALEESEMPLGKFAIQAFKGADVYSPKAKVSFKAPSIKAWAVSRKLFDRSLALEAVRNGVDLSFGSYVKSFRRNDGSCILSTGDDREIQARVVISAEGVRAFVARMAGIAPPDKILSGVQVELPFTAEDQEKVELHLGPAPGLFAWVIPLGNDMARIGLCTKENACFYLRKFLKGDWMKGRILGSPVDLVVGGLPMGPPTSTVAEGLIAVGDAAGQVKPTSGGGIYPGLVCAKAAGKVAAAAALEGDSSKKRLGECDRLWRARIGQELAVGMRLNNLLTSLTLEELDEIFAYLSRKPELLRLVEEHGDIDRPSILALKMLPHVGIDGLKLANLLRKAFF